MSHVEVSSPRAQARQKPSAKGDCRLSWTSQLEDSWGQFLAFGLEPPWEAFKGTSKKWARQQVANWRVSEMGLSDTPQLRSLRTELVSCQSYPNRDARLCCHL